MQEKGRDNSIFKERILNYLKKKGISNYECYKKTGMSRSVLSQTNGLTEDNLLRFIAYYTDINPDWLLTGNGSMLREKNGKENGKVDGKVEEKNVDVNVDVNVDPAFEIEKKNYNLNYNLNYNPAPEIEQKNAHLNAHPASGIEQKDAQEASGDKITPLYKDDQERVALAALADGEGIPLIPLDAVAGFCTGGSAQVMEYECEKYVVPSFRGAEFMISVKGSSMYPKYSSGDIVACKCLPLDTFFQWNKVYVVDTVQGVLIKRIRRGQDDEHITLVSENERYEPFEIRRDEIIALAIVIGVIRLE